MVVLLASGITGLGEEGKGKGRHDLKTETEGLYERRSEFGNDQTRKLDEAELVGMDSVRCSFLVDLASPIR